MQDLQKIKRHALGHEAGNFKCEYCGKEFGNNHLQLNAHKKIHVCPFFSFCIFETVDRFYCKTKNKKKQKNKKELPAPIPVPTPAND